MKLLVFILVAVFSWLLGGLNGAIEISKLRYKEDIREKGSKNPGFTNFKRVYGLTGWAWLVLVVDILKAAMPVCISGIIFNKLYGAFQLGAAYAGLFAMLGHCFPVWYKFMGGKAFIAGFATTWFVDWKMALIATVIFFIVLVAFKYMSVASCTAALTCPVALAFLKPDSVYVWVLCLLSALLVIVRHTPNFKKLKAGTESKFSFKK